MTNLLRLVSEPPISEYQVAILDHLPVSLQLLDEFHMQRDMLYLMISSLFPHFVLPIILK